MTLVGEKLKMPVLGVRPGVYRFELKDFEGKRLRSYVGESDNLERRMGNYRNPGAGQATNLRLNQSLRKLLQVEGTVAVSVVLEASVDGQALDLAAKSARLLVENTALVSLAASGGVVENLGTEA